MDNDVTWMKTNRFGAAALTVAGLLTALTALFANEATCLVMMFVYLTATIIAVLIRARRVYKEETAKDAAREAAAGGAAADDGVESWALRVGSGMYD